MECDKFVAPVLNFLSNSRRRQTLVCILTWIYFFVVYLPISPKDKETQNRTVMRIYQFFYNLFILVKRKFLERASRSLILDDEKWNPWAEIRSYQRFSAFWSIRLVVGRLILKSSANCRHIGCCFIYRYRKQSDHLRVYCSGWSSIVVMAVCRQTMIEWPYRKYRRKFGKEARRPYFEVVNRLKAFTRSTNNATKVDLT